MNCGSFSLLSWPMVAWECEGVRACNLWYAWIPSSCHQQSPCRRGGLNTRLFVFSVACEVSNSFPIFDVLTTIQCMLCIFKQMIQALWLHLILKCGQLVISSLAANSPKSFGYQEPFAVLVSLLLLRYSRNEANVRKSGTESFQFFPT